MSLEESLRIENQLGMPYVRSEETREGLDRFRQRKRQDSRST
ncbi:MAG: hypothetical protein QJR06_10995 [Alicyclobacillaceae bacterium]|nr:hypothetical protein [Alicyclobacillaceae bacterium]